jgi:hypothetical protein
MTDLSFWRLSEELTIVQAALLLVGQDPSLHFGVENKDDTKQPANYQAAKVAISNALLREDVEGRCIPMAEYDVDENVIGELPNTVAVYASTVDVESLRTWLASRGMKEGFFFAGGPVEPDYLDPNSTRYAPKLAAAIRAWEAMEDLCLLEGKTPKQALTKWLRENASRYGLSGDDGAPNETGIEEVAKVANWQPSGGAPRTPNQ